ENQAKARGQHRAERPICQLPEWNLSTLSPEKSKGTKAESHGALVCVAPMVKGRFLGMCLLLVAAAGLADGKGKGKKQGVRLLDAGRLEKFVDELPDIPVLRGYGVAERGRLVAGELAVGMYDTMWRKFHRDLPATRVFAYGASRETATVPGPTIVAMKGVPTCVTWTNHLPSHHILPFPWDPSLAAAGLGNGTGVPTVTHLHGGVQQSTSDGNSMAWFTSSFAATGPHFSSPAYEYPNQQPPRNLWYHDHAMGLTRVSILAGLLGAYRHASSVSRSPVGSASSTSAPTPCTSPGRCPRRSSCWRRPRSRTSSSTSPAPRTTR
uniref:Plastocyanin-like domain-containing protein n=1 Tax=Aegilops tauschii subsp. strangulata TaxID=200361 RepID=A0A452XLP2_AEGTS